LFFQCEIEDDLVKEIGLIEMSKEMELSPYKTLIKLSIWSWNVFEIENSSIVLAKGDVDQDKKLNFYRIPIR
jgi:hypothetical protein